ncbi:heavy-metal-associated domain-containing protein [Patescibacteria group bacterium]|nr:heavy-metal-associated domain-containing protein [Patescibacteria group bacterium]
MAHLEACEIQVLDKGIHCGGCETRIQSVLAKVKGVEGVKAHRKTQMVELSLDPDVVSIQDIKDRLEELGYSVA